MVNTNGIMKFGAKALDKVANEKVHRSLLILKKFSPEILTYAGVVGVVASAVLAARATLKLEETLIEAQDRKLEALDPDLDEQAQKKVNTRVYIKNATSVAKLYVPSGSLMIVSVGFVLGGHHVLKGRNVALVAAYKGLEYSYNEYRKRVAEEIGEERETDLHLNLRAVDQVDEETGETTVTKRLGDSSGISVYARFFDEYNENWSKTPEYNLTFLKNQQNSANDILHARGHIFLNEVYEMLGFDHTKEGSVVGWVKQDKGGIDGYVDFNLYSFQSMKAHEFINGQERSVLLDFNVDGLMFDKI